MPTKRFSSTSPIPEGTVSACAASFSTMLIGNRKLNATAAIAARNVENRYSKMTKPKRWSNFVCPFASEEITSTNTSTGAMAFNALTNRVPGSDRKEAVGTRSPSAAFFY